MNLIIYFILFLNILLVNSTLPGENSESSGGWQQNVGQMPKQNEHQSQMEHQFQYLEEDPFSQYYNLLASGNHENAYMDLLQSNSPIIQATLADVHLDPQFVDYHPQTEFHSQHGEQSVNPHPLPHYLPSGSSAVNFDQIPSSAVVGNEFDDWEYENGDLQGFEEQLGEIDGGNGKGKELKIKAEREKQRRSRFNGILMKLRTFLDKCKSFPILEEMTKAYHEKEKGKKKVNESDIWKGTLSIMRRCILVMESWMIKLEKEQKFIGMEPLIVNGSEISIEELILNARLNQKILKKHPLPFIEKESQNIVKSHKRKRNKRMTKGEKEKKKRINGAEIERKRRGDIIELQNCLFSTVPKEFIVKMPNSIKDTNMKTVIMYIEFLLNLLHPFMGHIQLLANVEMKQRN